MVSLLCQHARLIKPPFGFFSKNAKKPAKITLLNAAVFNLSKKARFKLFVVLSVDYQCFSDVSSKWLRY